MCDSVDEFIEQTEGSNLSDNESSTPVEVSCNETFNGSDEDLVRRLRRIRGLICPNQKYEDEVERCPCTRGGYDVTDRHGSGHQTGCKDILDAIERLES